MREPFWNFSFIFCCSASTDKDNGSTDKCARVLFNFFHFKSSLALSLHWDAIFFIFCCKFFTFLFFVIFSNLFHLFCFLDFLFCFLLFSFFYSSSLFFFPFFIFSLSFLISLLWNGILSTISDFLFAFHYILLFIFHFTVIFIFSFPFLIFFVLFLETLISRLFHFFFFSFFVFYFNIPWNLNLPFSLTFPSIFKGPAHFFWLF